MIYLSINIISMIGLLFSIDLIRKDLENSDYCPKFMKFPACYIILFSFFLVLFSNTIINNLFLYIFGSIIGLYLGLWFSYHEIRKTKKCPRFFEIPMCYVSLFTFVLLIILKFL
jgi:hypothetical protein